MKLFFLKKLIKTLVLQKIGGFLKQIDPSKKINYSKEWYESFCFKN